MLAFAAHISAVELKLPGSKAALTAARPHIAAMLCPSLQTGSAPNLSQAELCVGQALAGSTFEDPYRGPYLLGSGAVNCTKAAAPPAEETPLPLPVVPVVPLVVAAQGPSMPAYPGGAGGLPAASSRSALAPDWRLAIAAHCHGCNSLTIHVFCPPAAMCRGDCRGCTQKHPWPSPCAGARTAAS